MAAKDTGCYGSDEPCVPQGEPGITGAGRKAPSAAGFAMLAAAVITAVAGFSLWRLSGFGNTDHGSRDAAMRSSRRDLVLAPLAALREKEKAQRQAEEEAREKEGRKRQEAELAKAREQFEKTRSELEARAGEIRAAFERLRARQEEAARQGQDAGRQPGPGVKAPGGAESISGKEPVTVMQAPGGGGPGAAGGASPAVLPPGGRAGEGVAPASAGEPGQEAGTGLTAGKHGQAPGAAGGTPPGRDVPPPGEAGTGAGSMDPATGSAGTSATAPVLPGPPAAGVQKSEPGTGLQSGKPGSLTPVSAGGQAAAGLSGREKGTFHGRGIEAVAESLRRQAGSGADDEGGGRQAPALNATPGGSLLLPSPAGNGRTGMSLEERKFSAPMMGSAAGGTPAAIPADAAVQGRDSRPVKPGGGLSTMLESSPAVPARAKHLGEMTFILPRGSYIDCILETRINTTVPGLATCIIPRDVYSGNGRVLLLERGSRAIGEYRGAVENGMARIFLLWTEIRTPQGVSIELASPASDPLGGAGADGYVDFHWWRRFGNALMFSLVADAFDFAVTKAQESGSGSTYYSNTESGMDAIITEILRQSGNIPPTLYKNQGERIGIVAARDLDFSGVYSIRLAKDPEGPPGGSPGAEGGAAGGVLP